MTASVFHLFADIFSRRRSLTADKINVEHLALRDELIACHSGGGFPDIVLRSSEQGGMRYGGEFIEVKDSKSGYRISSFNSTIPTAQKRTRDFINRNGAMDGAMRDVGEDPDALEFRDVYYLIRGRKNRRYKVCLVCGEFFETVSESENIAHATGEIFARAIESDGRGDDENIRRATEQVLTLNFKREHFAAIKKHDRASVSVRMRVMTEVVPEANLLNANHYPQIADDTLSMVVTGQENYRTAERATTDKMRTAFGGDLPDDLSVARLDHLRNGPFVLFTAPLT